MENDLEEMYDASQVADAATNVGSEQTAPAVEGSSGPDLTKTADDAEPKPILFKFTNAAESPWLDSLLAMVYQGAYDNTLGIMEAWDLETESPVTLIVGVALDEDGKAECFPLFKLLKAEDVPFFLSPDGKGGYYDPTNPSEVADAKENMRSFNEAVVE